MDSFVGLLETTLEACQEADNGSSGWKTIISIYEKAITSIKNDENFSVEDAPRIYLEFNSDYTTDVFKLLDKSYTEAENFKIFKAIINDCIDVFIKAKTVSNDLACRKRYEKAVIALIEMRVSVTNGTYPKNYPVIPLFHYIERHMDEEELYNAMVKLDKWYAKNYRKSLQKQD